MPNDPSERVAAASSEVSFGALAAKQKMRDQIGSRLNNWSQKEDFLNFLERYTFLSNTDVVVNSLNNKKTKMLGWFINDVLIFAFDTDNKLGFIPKITPLVAKSYSKMVEDWPADNLKTWTYSANAYTSAKDNSNSVSFKEIEDIFKDLEESFSELDFYGHKRFLLYLYANLYYSNSMSNQAYGNNVKGQQAFEGFIGFSHMGYSAADVNELLDHQVDFKTVKEMGLTAETPVEWMITLLGSK